MVDQIISRAVARAKGIRYFFTGSPCKHGHVSKRQVLNGVCLSCSRIATERARIAHRDRNRVLKETLKNCPVEIERKKRAAREKQRAWHEFQKFNNFEKLRTIRLQASARYRRNHPEKAVDSVKRYRIKNAKRLLAANSKWRKNNPDAVKKMALRYRKKNADNILNINRRMRAKRKYGVPGAHSADDLTDILRLQKNRCAYCRIKFGVSMKSTLDHITALRNGGSHDRQNLQFLCRSCNSAKGARDSIEFARCLGRLL